MTILGYDIGFYFIHILLHYKMFYPFHKEHHKKVINLRYPDTFVGHHLESLIQPLGVFIPILFYPIQLIPFLTACFVIFIRGLMRHDERCVWLIGNHHLLHHCYPKYNFGEYWLDSLFGTSFPDTHKYQYGLIYI